MALNTTEELIEDIRQGKMVILMDDEDRENEGDLVIAAECVRPEDINFMARYGRGLICLTLTRERCRQLNLPLMVSDNNAQFSTNFTVSIEAAEGVTTGISAADRATTVLAAVKRDARPADVVQPGHIFPLMAQPGGVLNRAGHTEAGTDFARLGGFEPASVICEILKEDGSMARMPELLEFARQHELKIGTIADLINYRLANESTVQRVAECNLDTRYGDFRLYAYHDEIDQKTHLAIAKGRIRTDRPTLVRVSVTTSLYDRFSELKSGYGWSIESVLRHIAEADSGVLVLLDKAGTPADLIKQIRHLQMEGMGIEFPPAESSDELKTIGTGGQILADLGVGKMRVIGTPRKIHSLTGFGLDIIEYINDDQE
jgi:3,4-dihydroxy 2-butanone 4-phosphate synthase/GTP cyclohydrolase II